MPPIGDPGLLFGIDSLFSQSSLQQARIRATHLLKELKIDTSLPLVLVNWAAATSNVYGGDPGRLSRSVAESVSGLTSDHAVLLYPMWQRIDEAPPR